MKPNDLTYDMLYQDMEITDRDGNKGKVKEVLDIHNILIEFEDGRSGWYCLSPICENYTQITQSRG